MVTPSHSEHQPSALEEAEKVRELITHVITGQTGWSSAARAVLDVALSFYDDTIEEFVSCFGDEAGWWTLPVLPAERFIPFVTSRLYADEYRPIINFSDRVTPEWTAICEPDGDYSLPAAPEGKAMSLRQAVEFYFKELSTPGFADDACPAVLELSGLQLDETWITLSVTFNNAEAALKEVHDTLNFPLETTVKRIEMNHRSGWPVWVYEVCCGAQLIAQYAMLRDSEERQELDLAVQADKVKHYDFLDENLERNLRSERMEKQILSAMSHEGSAEGRPTTSTAL